MGTNLVFSHSIQTANVIDPNQARVLCILGNHSGLSQEAKQFQLDFGAEILRRHKCDIIGVEESASKKLQEFRLNQVKLPEDCKERYNIVGLDSPEIVKNAETLKKDLNTVIQAINKVRNQVAPTNDKETRRAYKTLIKFLPEASLTKENIYSELKNARFTNIFKRQREQLCQACVNLVIEKKRKFTRETFSERQKYICERIQQYMHKSPNKMVIFLGSLHGDETEEFSEEAKQLINVLSSTTFIVYNPDRYFKKHPNAWIKTL